MSQNLKPNPSVIFLFSVVEIFIMIDPYEYDYDV